MTTDDFLTDKRNAVRAYVRELTGERVGPCGVDAVIVPYLFELNAIPGCFRISVINNSCTSFNSIFIINSCIKLNRRIKSKSLIYLKPFQFISESFSIFLTSKVSQFVSSINDEISNSANKMNRRIFKTSADF